jgi:3-deoxy-D-manno-octulosonate 8-phosphate phosphatase (KDO 8-P phosphatase)
MHRMPNATMTLTNTARFSPALLQRARGATGAGIRLAFFDVDGVLTDGRLYIGGDGESFKAFHVLDGHGLKLLQQSGVQLVVITGRDSPAVRRRLHDLGVVHASFGVADKAQAAAAWLQSLQVSWDAVAAIGDDWPDLPLLQQAAFACAPPGAHVEVRACAHHVTQARAGEGAAREFCDLLLTASGHYDSLLLQHRPTTLDGS